jgi:hypothetical protein
VRAGNAIRWVDRWERGRLAAAVALGYLIVVAGVFAFVLVDINLVEHQDASFSGVWAFLVTLPLSLVLLLLTPAVEAGLVGVALTGVVQAVLLWLALRGPRIAR